MKSGIAGLLAGLLICVATTVRADPVTVTNFDLAAALQIGTARGTIAIDTIAGRITGGNFTVNGPAPPGLPPVVDVFTRLQSAGFNGTTQFADFLSGTDRFELSLPRVSLVGYAGSSICSTTERTGCTIADSQGYFPTIFIYFGGELADVAVSGSLTPSSVPEPPTYLLLGTGVAVVVARKRLTMHLRRCAAAFGA